MAPIDRVDRRLVLILMTMFLDIFGVGIILPVAPFYATAFGADAFAVGLLFTCYAGAQFLATPVLGSLSDRYGRRPILILSLLGEALGFGLMALAGDLTALYVARLITGTTAGNIGAAQAYLADITPPERRTSAFALAGAVFVAGFVCGPAVAALLSPIDLRLTAVAAAGLVLLTAILALVMLPESLPPERRSGAPLRGQLNPFGVLARVVRRPSLQAPLLVTFLLNLAFSSVQGTVAILMLDRFGFDASVVAMMFVGMALAAMVTYGLVVRQLSARFDDTTILLAGVVITSGACIALASASDPVVGVTGLVLFSVGISLWRSPLTSLITKLVTEREQGLANGAAQSATALAAMCGPLLAGALYVSFGSPWPYWTAAAVTGLAGATVVAHLEGSVAPRRNGRLTGGVSRGMDAKRGYHRLADLGRKKR